ncbi:MAG: hypothetical protein GY898_23040 [Proteobacteria bacterium]|nr:hypothetical protein [Pseudomonadota bacterium]
MKWRINTALVLVGALLLAGCASEISSVTVPDPPTPAEIAGAWAGNARWDAVQGGAPGAITSGAATAIFFQSGATILSSTWGVTGVFTGTFSGSIDPDGNATGTATVLVLGAACGAAAPWGGKLEGDQLAITVSFATPGTVPCAGAPVGLTFNLSR